MADPNSTSDDPQGSDAQRNDEPADDAGGDGENNGQGSSDDGQGNDDGQGSSDGGDSEGKNVLEWGVTIAGAAIVLFVAGFFVYASFAGGSGSADLRVTLGEPKRTAAGIEVPVEVQNAGARVAEAAVVEVCTATDRCAQITFDYIPYKSRVTGLVGFEPPLEGALSARVVSYRDP